MNHTRWLLGITLVIGIGIFFYPKPFDTGRGHYMDPSVLRIAVEQHLDSSDNNSGNGYRCLGFEGSGGGVVLDGEEKVCYGIPLKR